MGNWLNQVVLRGESIHDGLSLKRQQSLQLLKNTPQPTRKTEAWKYTSLRSLEQLDLPKPLADNNDTTFEPIANLDTLDLVFIDGQLQNPLDLHTIPGLQISRLGDPSHQAELNQLFSSVKPNRHYFGLVNDVLATNGLLIEVEANTRVNKPIRIVSKLRQGGEAHLRLLVRLGHDASLTLIEQGDGNDASINTFFSEYQLDRQAQLDHYRLNLQSQNALGFAGNHFRLDERAQLNTNILAFGSQLSRLDVDVIHAGQNSGANINGIYLLDQKELFDLHACVEHTMPNGQTVETIRGIVGGEARAVFNGRIHIHPHAQKTDAQLNNRNLLLSNRAEVDTKPELEIYADDVRCAHGATVSQMEDRSLYYLQSRGVDRQQAQAMLMFGFINELLEQMPHTEIGDWLRPQIHQRFDAAFSGQG